MARRSSSAPPRHSATQSHAEQSRNAASSTGSKNRHTISIRCGCLRYSRLRETGMPNELSDAERSLIDAYWRAANYLSVGQIYLYDNPLLKERLTKEHIKPRLLGHWGTTPGLNFIYVHLNRLIKKYGLDMIYITGPGYGGPGLIANAYLEGTYSEVYPNISADA